MENSSARAPRGDHKSIRGNIRLLNAQTRKLERFSNTHVPKYAILSHTWGSEEVTFEDFQQGLSVESLASYWKIRQACEQATRDGFEYVWIDTCCIDKSSSAELSESINSMWEWYEKADICYAFLRDVCADVACRDWDPEWRSEQADGGEQVHADAQASQVVRSDSRQNYDASAMAMNWHDSRWFTRGWTLQELIAPREVVFYDCHWRLIGTRNGDLLEQICSVTKVPVSVLSDVRTRHQLTVAQRMSWAADRRTTRLEDEAYCLMGLFDVNMPLLYGERRKAFIRLQEEIIRTSTDQSIFAWPNMTPSMIASQLMRRDSLRDLVNSEGKEAVAKKLRFNDILEEFNPPTLLAHSPNTFRGTCADAVPTGRRPWDEVYTLTNQGLRVTLPVLDHATEGLLGILNCRTKDGILALRLMSVGRPQYVVGAFPLKREGRNDRYLDERVAIVYPHHVALAKLTTITIARSWPKSASNMIRERLYARECVGIRYGKIDFTRFDLSACVSHIYPFDSFDSKHITVRSESVGHLRIGGVAYTGVPLIDSFCVCFACDVSKPEILGSCEISVGHCDQRALRDRCHEYCKKVSSGEKIRISNAATAYYPYRKFMSRTTAYLLRAKLIGNKNSRNLQISLGHEFSARWMLLKLETWRFGDPIVSGPANNSILDKDWYVVDNQDLSGEMGGISKRIWGLIGISCILCMATFLATLLCYVAYMNLRRVCWPT